MFCEADTLANGVLCEPLVQVHFLSTTLRDCVALHDGVGGVDTSAAQAVSYTVYEGGGVTVMAGRLPPYGRGHAESLSFATVEEYLDSGPNSYMQYRAAGTRVRQRRACGLFFPTAVEHVVLRVAPVALRTVLEGEEVVALTEGLMGSTLSRVFSGGRRPDAGVVGRQIRALANVVALIGVTGSFFDAIHSCEYTLALGLLSLLGPGAPSGAMLFSAVAHSAPSCFLHGMRSFVDGTECTVKWQPTVLLGSKGDTRVCCKINGRSMSVSPANVRCTSGTPEDADPVPRLREMIGTWLFPHGGCVGAWLWLCVCVAAECVRGVCVWWQACVRRRLLFGLLLLRVRRDERRARRCGRGRRAGLPTSTARLRPR